MIGSIFSAAAAPDHSGIYVVGSFTQIVDAEGTTTSANGLAKIRNNGTVDTGFVGSGMGLTGGGQGFAVVATDQHVYVGGSFSQYQDPVHGVTSILGLVRVGASDGVLDTSFTTGGDGLSQSGGDEAIHALALDGDFLYAGYQATDNTPDTFTIQGVSSAAAVNKIFRINVANSTYSSLLQPGVNGDVASLIVSDGRLVVAGEFSLCQVQARVRICSISTTSGAADPSFLPGAGPAATVESIVSTAAGIVVGGIFSDYRGNAAFAQIVRLDPASADPDAGFANTAGPVGGNVFSVASFDGAIWAGGAFSGWADSGAVTHSVPNFMKLSDDGGPDTEYLTLAKSPDLPPGPMVPAYVAP
jgi:hypothetical protein